MMSLTTTSLSPPVTLPEPVPNTSLSASCSKRHPRTRGHPCPSPTVALPLPSVSLLNPAVALASSLPVAIPSKLDKGKGCQRAATPASPASPVDTPSPVAATSTSAELTPEQHICFVRMLKRLDKWLTQGWEPGVDKSHLRNLAEIFNATEGVAEGSLSNIRCTDLAWRLADCEGWEKSAGSSIMGAIDIQVTVTKILFKDYGNPLIASFRSFLG